MSGHSKWSQIKRQKGVADVKRSSVYTKLGHMIALAVREGGKDPTMNFKLRLALEKAKAVNMPSSTIERAIKRGTGELLGESPIESVVYEGYGPGGAAILIEAATNNKNRTAAEIRHLLGKHGGTVGSSGSVQWLFETHGKVSLSAQTITDEQELSLIDAGAQDIVTGDGDVVVITQPDNLETLKKRCEEVGLSVHNAELILVPKTRSTFDNDRERESFLALLDELEELDEVTRVTSNAQA